MARVLVALATASVFSLPAFAASPFDGAYSGAATWAGNGNSRCPPTITFTVNINDGKFFYAGGGERVPVVIAPDGSFSAHTGQRNLEGKIQGGQLTANLNGDRCNYTWSLHK